MCDDFNIAFFNLIMLIDSHREAEREKEAREHTPSCLSTMASVWTTDSSGILMFVEGIQVPQPSLSATPGMKEKKLEFGTWAGTWTQAVWFEISISELKA